jgi:hypothetical protein
MITQNRKTIRERAKMRQKLISKTYEPYFPQELKQKKFNKLKLSSRVMDRSLIDSSQELSRSKLDENPKKKNRYNSVKPKSPSKRKIIKRTNARSKATESTTFPEIVREKPFSHDKMSHNSELKMK